MTNDNSGSFQTALEGLDELVCAPDNQDPKDEGPEALQPEDLSPDEIAYLDKLDDEPVDEIAAVQPRSPAQDPDEQDEVPIEEPAVSKGGNGLPDALKAFTDKWQARHDELNARAYHARGEENRATWRREQRERYAAEKAAQGLTVRSYKHHDHGEIPLYEDPKLVRSRNRQRTARGVTEATVRQYTDLSDLSDEDRAAYKRAQSAKRLREHRARKKAEKDAAKGES